MLYQDLQLARCHYHHLQNCLHYIQNFFISNKIQGYEQQGLLCDTGFSCALLITISYFCAFLLCNWAMGLSVKTWTLKFNKNTILCQVVVKHVSRSYGFLILPLGTIIQNSMLLHHIKCEWCVYYRYNQHPINWAMVYLCVAYSPYNTSGLSCLNPFCEIFK